MVFSKRVEGQIPIVLGVTGHRDIDSSDQRLIAAVNVQCHHLKRCYKHSPFVILSSLAEGADRLVAQVAMHVLSAGLIAVLPLPKEEFEKDFASDESKAEFRRLLASAICVHTVPVSGDKDWRVPGEGRNRHYARAGAVIVDHAQILFALWDGQPARGLGGTGQQVEWFRQGYSPKQYSFYADAITPLDPLEPGRMIWIHPKTGKAIPYQGPTFPDGEDAGGTSSISSILRRIDDYNFDVSAHPDAAAKVDALAEKVGALSLANETYRSADALSVRYATAVRRTDNIIYLLALFAIFAFSFVGTKPLAPGIYLGITALMVLLGGIVWFWRKDDRLLEYRGLAEAMRTLFFWRSAGLKNAVWLPFLSRQSGVVHWIRHAVRTVEFCQDCLLARDGEPTAKKLEGFIKSDWVDSQKKWFTGRQQFHRGRYEFWSKIIWLTLGASFLIAIALAVMTALPYSGRRSFWHVLVKPDAYSDYWQAALGLLAAGSLVVKGFVTRKAHLELAKQYASQKLLFDNASRILSQIQNKADVDWTEQEVLAKLGQEALREQGEWLWLRHTRPFEVPS